MYRDHVHVHHATDCPLSDPGCEAGCHPHKDGAASPPDAGTVTVSHDPVLLRAHGRQPVPDPGLLAGLLASAACGLVGPHVVTRRIVFLSGAIAHMAVGASGRRSSWQPSTRRLQWLTPLHGATAAALAAAVLIGIIHQRVAERMDTLIGLPGDRALALGDHIMLIKFTPPAIRPN